MKTARKQIKMHRIYYGKQKDKKLYWPVKVRDARVSINIPHHVKNVLQGKRGMSLACMRARDCMDAGENIFGHPCLLAEWLDSVAYIVTKITKGKPSHAVRYRHTDLTQKQFDNGSITREEMIEQGFGEGWTRLGPPQRRDSSSYRPPSDKTRERSGHHAGESMKPIARGAWERARRAGLVF